MDKGKIVDTGTYQHLFTKYPHVFEKILKEVKEQENKSLILTEEMNQKIILKKKKTLIV